MSLHCADLLVTGDAAARAQTDDLLKRYFGVTPQDSGARALLRQHFLNYPRLLEETCFTFESGVSGPGDHLAFVPGTTRDLQKYHVNVNQRYFDWIDPRFRASALFHEHVHQLQAGVELPDSVKDPLHPAGMADAGAAFGTRYAQPGAVVTPAGGAAGFVLVEPLRKIHVGKPFELVKLDPYVHQAFLYWSDDIK
jgi:hypothetical protein